MTDTRHKPRVHFEDPLLVFPWMLSKLKTLWFRSAYPFASLGRGVRVHYSVVLNRAISPRIKLGDSVVLSKDVWLNIIPEATDEVNIVIDDNCFIGPRTWISAKNHIWLGPDVVVGPSVLIMDHSHSYERVDQPIRLQTATEGGRIQIERGCSIGMGAAIISSKGLLVLGHHSTIAPNTVVLRSVPPYSIIEGNPGRIIGQLDPTGVEQGSETSTDNVQTPASGEVQPR